MKQVFKYINYKYFIRFVIIYCILTIVNEFFVGVTTPGGIYSSFIEKFLNYPAWIRSAVLYGANFISSLFGVSSIILNDTLSIPDGPKVIMGWPCVGLGIMSFWFAFVMAHSESMKKRIKWVLLGFFFVWLINCLRVALVLIFMKKDWVLIGDYDNHDVFNYSAYVLIAIMIVLFRKQNGQLKFSAA